MDEGVEMKLLSLSERRSIIAKKLWSDPEYRKRACKKQKEWQSDPTYREMRSVQAKERCSDPEIRKLMSERAKKKWKDPEYRKKQEAIRKDSLYRKQQSEKQLGTRTGEENYMFGKPAPHGSGHGVGGWFYKNDDSKVWLRSSYETRVATILTNFNITWKYENKMFDLIVDEKRTTYRPDFYLPDYNLWWEVKGYWNPVSKKKVKNFIEQYPMENIRIVYIEDIIQLEQNSVIDVVNVGSNPIYLFNKEEC